MNTDGKIQARIDKIGVPLLRVTFRLMMIRCSRHTCVRCPHGPYYYAYWREGKKVKSRYIGKELPMAARKSREQKLKERQK